MSLETDFHVLTSYPAYRAVVLARKARQDFKDCLDNIHADDWTRLRQIETELEERFQDGTIGEVEYEAACETYSDQQVYTPEERDLLDMFTAVLARAEAAAGYGLPAFSCQSGVSIEDTVLRTADDVRAFLSGKGYSDSVAEFLGGHLQDLQSGKVILVEQELH